MTQSVASRETGGWNSLSRYNSSSRRLIALPQLAAWRAPPASVSHIPVLTARSITYFMLSGGGGGGALQVELTDSWKGDDSDRPAALWAFPHLVFSYPREPSSSSPDVLRSSDDPISLSQSETAIELSVVSIKSRSNNHLEPVAETLKTLIYSRQNDLKMLKCENFSFICIQFLAAVNQWIGDSQTHYFCPAQYLSLFPGSGCQNKMWTLSKLGCLNFSLFLSWTVFEWCFTSAQRQRFTSC